MEDLNKLSKDERCIILFKYFIEFLEIWGQENYGENTEIDWPKALRECQKLGLFDFNQSLEEVIYTKTDDEFRDLAFKWIENKVLSGMAIWRFFKLSPWLLQKLEEENTANLIEFQKAKYKKHKCFRCKYYRDNASWFKDTIDGPKLTLVDDELPPTEKPIVDRPECLKRKLLIALASGNGPKFREPKLEYTGFNTQINSRETWRPDPEKLHRCPYFEEGGLTLEGYLTHTFGVKF